jgi:hypothetical protein
MGAQSNGANSESNTVVPFAPALENAASDQLDRAGQTILSILHNAANFAEANYQHALDSAQKLSHQLHAAEARIAELEAEGQTYQERAERAEQWLLRVYSEIEDRFLKRVDRHGTTGGSRFAQSTHDASLADGRTSAYLTIELDVIRCVSSRLSAGQITSRSQNSGTALAPG